MNTIKIFTGARPISHISVIITSSKKLNQGQSQETHPRSESEERKHDLFIIFSLIFLYCILYDFNEIKQSVSQYQTAKTVFYHFYQYLKTCLTYWEGSTLNICNTTC